METSTLPQYEFGDFRMDPARRLLRRRDGTQVPLTPRVFDTLLYLVEHHDTVLDKERLMEAVWPDSIVEENNLSQNISTLRRVFGETPGSHRFIVTVPGRGYRFVADVHAAGQRADDVTDITGVPAIAVTNKANPSPVRSSLFLPAFAIGLLTVAVVGTALLLWRPSPPRPTAGSNPPASISPKSIAVLPFDNLSDDPQNAYFAAGVQDEILSNLAKIADLKVISRTSANLYKTGTPRNSREIGEQLGVAHLLEGSVQRNGDRVRVHAQLIDTRNDSHLWAQTYDREIADVFAIQSEVAEAIANQLNVKISISEKAAVALPPTRDLVAKDLYLQALAATVAEFGIEELRDSIGLLEKAIARDPNFVEAYCALARAHVELYSNGIDHTPSHLDVVAGIIDKAAGLQPDAGEVHLTRARYLARGRRDYDRARAELELARRALPNDATLYFEIALTDRRQGRWSEAVTNFERAIELDPLNYRFVAGALQTYLDLRRYADATRLARRAVALAPQNYEIRLLAASQSFRERADFAPYLAELNALIAENPEAARDVADDLFYCALCGRDHAGVERALAAIPPEGTVAVADMVWPRELYVAVAAQASGQPEAARAAFVATRSILQGILREQPAYAPTWSLLGRVEAALGNKEEAIKAGRRACELLPLSREPTSGLKPLNDLARIYAAVDEKDVALEILTAYIPQPAFTDYGRLKLDPDWDPLRSDPRFERLVASLAPKD